MMKGLLLFAALVASALGGTILYKGVGVYPYATGHGLGLGITKQYGESIQGVSSAFPLYGLQNNLVGVQSGPNYHHAGVDSIGHLAAQLSGGLIDTDVLQTGPIGVIANTGLGPVAYGAQSGPNYHHAGVDSIGHLAAQLSGGLIDTDVLQTGPIGVIANTGLGPVAYGVQGQAPIAIAGQAGSLYVGEATGDLLQGAGVQYPLGQPGVLYQGQYYPTQQVVSHHQAGHYIGAEEIEALKSHATPYLIPIAGHGLGGMSHYTDADDLSNSILYQKLQSTPYSSGSLFGQLIGGYPQIQVPLSGPQVAMVGPYAHSGVIGVQHGIVSPFQTPSGVHQWFYNAANHHY